MPVRAAPQGVSSSCCFGSAAAPPLRLTRRRVGSDGGRGTSRGPSLPAARRACSTWDAPAATPTHAARGRAPPAARRRAAARCCCAISAAAPTQYADCLPFSSRSAAAPRLRRPRACRWRRPLRQLRLESSDELALAALGPHGKLDEPRRRALRLRRRATSAGARRCPSFDPDPQTGGALLNRRRASARREQRVGLYHGGRRGGRGMVEAARQPACRGAALPPVPPLASPRRRPPAPPPPPPLRRLLLRRRRLRRRFRRRRRRLSRRLGLRLRLATSPPLVVPPPPPRPPPPPPTPPPRSA